MSATDEYDRMLKKPHFYTKRSTILQAAKKVEPEVVSFIDLALPFGELTVSVVENDERSEVEETVLNIFEVDGKVEVLSYLSYGDKGRMAGLPFFLFRISIGPNPDDPSRGVLRTLKHDNLHQMKVPGYRIEKEKIEQFREKSLEYICDLVAEFCLAISKSKELREGNGETRKKVHRHMNGAKAYSNYSVIYLESNKVLSKKNYNTGDGVKWSNSWSVRGHWRYFFDKTKPGKGRDGERTQTGRSWVLPYTKQKELENNNKLRILK